MCFSATASFTAAAVLTGGGALTVSVAKNKKELPLASVPFFFGIQQCIEGFIWLSFRYPVMGIFNAPLTYIYSIFAYVFWPIFVPFIMIMIETVKWRKNLLYILQVIGLATGGWLLYIHASAPVTCQIINHSIVYNSVHASPLWATFGYGLATVGSLLLSSRNVIRILGAFVFVGLVAAYYFYAVAFVSVWCFFAAIVSVVIYLYLNRNVKVSAIIKRVERRLKI